MGLLLHIAGIVAAVWVFNDARKVGHSFAMSLLWALGVVAFIVIFLPMYLLVGRRRPLEAQPEKELQLENVTVEGEAELVATTPCPMCGKAVRDDYKLCPYCGFTLHLKCKTCGRPLERDWVVCPNCQTPTPKK